MSTPNPRRRGDSRRPGPGSGTRTGSDSGSAFLETAAVLILAAAIIVALFQLELSQTFNNGVRQMVCLVEGPECGESWTEEERPEEPQSYGSGSGIDEGDGTGGGDVS